MEATFDYKPHFFPTENDRSRDLYSRTYGICLLQSGQVDGIGIRERWTKIRDRKQIMRTSQPLRLSLMYWKRHNGRNMVQKAIALMNSKCITQNSLDI